MTTPEQLQAESVYAAELRRRGFESLGRPKGALTEDELEELEEKCEVHILGNDPCFLQMGGESRTTYAMDDTGMFWRIEGFMDLTDLGFKKQPVPREFAGDHELN